MRRCEDSTATRALRHRGGGQDLEPCTALPLGAVRTSIPASTTPSRRLYSYGTLLTNPRGRRLEICVGMMCGSLPCIKPLYSRVRYGKLKDSTAASYQLSSPTRKTGKGENAIYFSQDVEFSVQPAPPFRPDSQASMIPRTLTYGHAESQVHSVPRL